MELQLNGITKTFGEKLVLDNIALTVGTGSAMGLLGRNGAGKTTTIRIIMGVFPPDSGTVSVDSKQISHSGVTFGYLPEERGLYPKQKILDQMIYIGELRGLSRSDARKSALRWLDRMEMSEHANVLLSTLSKGNQQKIQLAVALVNDPDIIILDEPFSGLDPVNAQLLKDVVTEQVHAGRLVIFSSHQMGYVEEFCDNIAILDKGKIVLDGNLRQIKRSYDRTNILISLDGGDTLGRLASWKETGMFDGFIKEIQPSGDDAVVRVAAPSDKDRLLSAVLNSGASLETFQVLEPTLEEIFVEKAGDGQ